MTVLLCVVLAAGSASGALKQVWLGRMNTGVRPAYLHSGVKTDRPVYAFAASAEWLEQTSDSC